MKSTSPADSNESKFMKIEWLGGMMNTTDPNAISLGIFGIPWIFIWIPSVFYPEHDSLKMKFKIIPRWRILLNAFAV